MLVLAIASLLLPPALGIAFPGPAPTAKDSLDIDGFTPKPTNTPLSLPELFRRQQQDPGMCGYINGESDGAVSCTIGTCLYDDSISWFGCCTGRARSDCALFTTCVASASISSCLKNSKCASDDYALACTASTAGECMTLWGEVDEGSVSHYVCGASSTKVQVVATATTGPSVGSATSSRATGSASRGAASRSSSTDDDSRSSSNDDDSRTSSNDDDSRTSSTDDASSTSTTRTRSTGTTSSSERPSANTAVTSTRASTSLSTAGAMKTAQALVGAAGGLAGVIAWFV